MKKIIRRTGILLASIFSVSSGAIAGQESNIIRDKDGVVIGYKMPKGVLMPDEFSNQEYPLIQKIDENEINHLVKAFAQVQKDKIKINRETNNGFSIFVPRLKAHDIEGKIICGQENRDRVLNGVVCELLNKGKLRYRGKFNNNHAYEISIEESKGINLH